MRITFLVPLMAVFLTSFQDGRNAKSIAHGILTNDYGIVTEKDVEDNAKIANSIDSENPERPFLVWQCLPIEDVQMECENQDYDEELNSVTCDPTLSLTHDGKHYEFWVRRLQYLEDYQDMELALQSLFKDEEIACFSAFYDWDEPMSETGSRSLWTLDRIKTRRGEWSYFSAEG